MPFKSIPQTPSREIIPGFHGVFIHSESTSVAHWKIDAKAVLKPHAHPHEQISLLVEGLFEMTIGNETRRLGIGDVAIIPPNIPHEGVALSDCIIIDVFYPRRSDLTNE